MLVPSDDYPDGLTALKTLITDGSAVRAAVAFVTDSGVGLLGEVLASKQDVTVELVARAADVTTPSALRRARDQLGCDVSVAIGRDAPSFHPKLWLIESGATLTVIAGSGNLTSTGLTTNEEQFEVIAVPADSDEARAHSDRFDRLTRKALPLDQIEGSAVWERWLAVIKKQAQWRQEMERVARPLNQQVPLTDRSHDKAVLLDDLQRLYDDTVAAKLPRKDGGHYVPSRFLQGIRRVRDGENDAVRLVTQLIRKRTDGFDVLLTTNRPDLTLEQLVLATDRPYHDLFYEKSRELSRERLKMFPSS